MALLPSHVRKIILFAAILFAGITFFMSPFSTAEAEIGIPSEVQEEIGLPNDLEQTMLRVVRWLLTFLALAAAILVIYGGFIWLTAAGNEEKITQAKKTITAAVIGIVIIALAWAMVWFVTQGVLSSGGDSGGEGPPPPP
ncbi:MAG: hypothetical protein Q8Q20_02055 [bacterium]|nr:hypothetical protein [bacterium]